MTTTEDLAREAGFAGDGHGAPLLRIFESFRSLVEREAYRKGQEDMRERAAVMCETAWQRMTDDVHEIAENIRQLPVEEPK